jgi:hypothetical protein
LSLTALKESVVIVNTGIDALAFNVLKTKERIVSSSSRSCISNNGIATGIFNITLLLDEGGGFIVDILAIAARK